VFLIFEDIKIEIESKIKSIDKSIYELKNNIRRITEQSKSDDLNVLLHKM
jgi:hypothetical protein